MTAADFRRIALDMEGAEEGAHMGAVDFRVGGRIFATLAHVKQGYGNLMFTPTEQAEFCAERPDVFLPVAGGWGRTGATHIRLAAASEEAMAGALHTAWKRRVEANAKGRAPKSVKEALIQSSTTRASVPSGAEAKMLTGPSTAGLKPRPFKTGLDPRLPKSVKPSAKKRASASRGGPR